MQKTLGEVATIVMGQSPKGTTYNNDGIGKPLLNGPTEFGAVHPHCTLYTTDSKRESEIGDLIFCVRGSTTGRMNWAERRYSLGRGVCAIRGESIWDTKYIRYCIENRLSALLKYAGGATFPNLTRDDLLDFPIPYQAHRRKIAAILSAYDDLIENNLRRIKILEELAQRLYQEWFVNFRFPGHEIVRMVDSPLGKIPQGWEVVELGELAKQVRRGVDPTTVEPDTPYVGLEHIPRKSIALSDWGCAADVQSTKFLFRKGEILFGKIRPYFHKVAIAPLDGICSSDTIVIKEKDSRWFPVVLTTVSSERFIDEATRTSNGTKMPRANWDVLVKYPVPLPETAVLERFNQFVNDSLAQIHNLIFRNINLRQTRDLLLPKLISGELDVSELAIKIKEVIS